MSINTANPLHMTRQSDILVQIIIIEVIMVLKSSVVIFLGSISAGLYLKKKENNSLN